MMRRKSHRWLGLPIFLAVLAASAAIVMLLWNALIPAIIGWSAVSFWQAAGLIILCRLLLGGFGFLKNRPFPHFHHAKMDDMHRKFHGMDPEQRREFIRRRMRGMTEPPVEQPE